MLSPGDPAHAPLAGNDAALGKIERRVGGRAGAWRSARDAEQEAHRRLTGGIIAVALAGATETALAAGTGTSIAPP